MTENRLKKPFFIKKRIAVSTSALILFCMFIFFSRSRWEDIGIVSDIFFLIGAIMVGVATVGRLWCSIFISGYKVKKLITVGPYSLCRNPLYLFSFIGAVGIGFATEMLAIPALIAVAFGLYYPYVIRQEEKRLEDLHGSDFAEYVRKVPRIVPLRTAYNEPEKFTVHTDIFRKRLFDSLWFIWIMGGLEIMEALHKLEMFPVLFNFY